MNLKIRGIKNNIVIHIIVLILLILATLFCVNNFIRLDKNMYYYGINSLNIYKPINGWVTPINGFLRYGSFGNPYCNSVELWEDDYTLVGKGIVYNKFADIIMDSLISYGFNDNCVVAECITNTQNNYYIIFKNSEVVTLINKDSCANDSPLHYFQLKVWFDSINNPPQQMIIKHCFYKRICIILIFVMLFCFLHCIIYVINKKTNNIFNLCKKRNMLLQFDDFIILYCCPVKK